jgi:hypothetical protein
LALNDISKGGILGVGFELCQPNFTVADESCAVLQTSRLNAQAAPARLEAGHRPWQREAPLIEHRLEALPLQSENGTWNYADYKGQVGPLTLEQLKKTIPKFPQPASVLVWRNGFVDWARPGDVAELREQTSQPPPPPSDNMPTWRVKWWWYPVPFISIGIEIQVGRKVMIWNSMQRRNAKQAQRDAKRRAR